MIGPRFAAHSDVGRTRSHNEDSCTAMPPLFAVADGVGGAASGERASSTALRVLAAHAGSISTHGDDADAQRAMAEAIEACNAQIHADQLHDDRHAGMATTLTSLVLRPDNTLVVGHVGDSRAYRISIDGTVTQLTDDHSIVWELVKSGQLSADEAAVHPQRNVITRALGPEQHVSVDTAIITVDAGDWLLLCSDGLTAHVSDRQIGDVVAAGGDPATAAGKLIDMANDGGGSDNISVVLVQPLPLEPAVVTPSPSEISGEIVMTPLADNADEPAPPDLEADVPNRSRSGLRHLIVVVAILLVAAAIGGFAWSQSYFVAADSSGLVVIRQGFPVAGLHRTVQQSTVRSGDLSSSDRERYVDDHTLRGRHDAEKIIRKLPALAGLCSSGSLSTTGSRSAPDAAAATSTQDC